MAQLINSKAASALEKLFSPIGDYYKKKYDEAQSKAIANNKLSITPATDPIVATDPITAQTPVVNSALNAMIPANDNELYKNRYQTETMPLLQDLRRRQAYLSMVPSGSLTSGALSTLGTRMRGQTAMAMSDIGRKIGTDIYAAQEARRPREEQLAMDGWTRDEQGQLQYAGGKIFDPEQGGLVSPEELGRQITQADVDRTKNYYETRAGEFFARRRPEEEAKARKAEQDYYLANPEEWMNQNEWTQGWMGIGKEDIPQITQYLKNNDEEGLRKFLYEQLDPYYSRSNANDRLEKQINVFKAAGYLQN